MVEDIAALKADRNEIDSIAKLTEALNTRIKHISILLAELAKTIVPNVASSSFKGGENINTKLLRRDFMRKQAEIVKDWINDTKLVDNLQGVTSGAHKNLKVIMG
jgi:hypothetical protein